jgi:hypothetical protein
MNLKNPQFQPLIDTLGRKLTADEMDYLNKVWWMDERGGKNTIGGKHMIPKMPKEGLEKLLRERPSEPKVQYIMDYSGW